MQQARIITPGVGELAGKVASPDSGWFAGMPLWARLVSAIGAMLALTWTITVVLTYVERRDAAIADAQVFAESTNQMINATLTGMMITGVSKERAVFLDQVRESNNIKNLRVLRYGSVISELIQIQYTTPVLPCGYP
ncbi:MAG: hypothetical protein IH606_06250 [Burkholderiales bacterium]|nr:hypothetical protein [Burkholderiales bacterium]